MSVSTRFLEAWVNSNVRVFGRTLRPFSLRHLMWLYALESPFAKAIDGELTDVEKLAIKDLRVFVAICSSKNDEEVWRNLGSRLRYAGVFAWSRRDAWLYVTAYLRDYVTQPSVVDVKTKARLLGAPWILRMVVKLCRAGFGNEEQVWNMAVGKAIWYSAALDEVDGGLLLGDSSFEQFLEEAEPASA